eukprot:768749-Hanusia_phi.AAC.35
MAEISERACCKVAIPGCERVDSGHKIRRPNPSCSTCRETEEARRSEEKETARSAQSVQAKGQGHLGEAKFLQREERLIRLHSTCACMISAPRRSSFPPPPPPPPHLCCS